MAEEENKEENNTNKSAPIVRAATGGLVGATAGYLSAPGNRKKLRARVNKEALKTTSTSLGTVTKEKLNNMKDAGKEKSSKAYHNLKSASSNMLHKDSSKGDSTGDANIELVQDNDGEDEEMSYTGQNDEGYEEIKVENEELKNRLESLEEKLDKLLSGGGQDNEADDEGEVSDDTEAEEKDDTKQEGKQSKKKDSKKSSSTSSKKSKAKKEDDDQEGEDTATVNDDDTSS